MKKQKLCFLLIWLVGVPLLGSAIDVLVDTQGREVEAEILFVGEESVRIRKLSDGKEFELPLFRLSAESLALVAKRKAALVQPVAPSIKELWRRLQVTLPNAPDFISASGMNGSGMIKVGARGHDLTLRVDGWVKVNLFTNDRTFEQMIPYDGNSKDLRFSMDGHCMLLSKDGQPPQVVGVTLLEELDSSEWFQLPDGVEFAETISVETQVTGQSAVLHQSPVPISAVLATNYPVEADDCREIAQINPKGLAIDLRYKLADSLKHFEGSDVEAWSLEFMDEPMLKDGKRRASYPVDLPMLPNMKFFNLFFDVVPSGLPGDMIYIAPNVIALSISASSQSAKFANGGPLADLPKLEFLNTAWGTKTDPEVLTSLKNLKGFCCNLSGVNVRSPAISEWATKKGMIWLQLTLGQIPQDMVKKWASNGGLKNVIEFTTFKDPDFSFLTNMESVIIRRSEKDHAEFDLTKLGGLEKLRRIEFWRVSQEELETLAALPNRDQIESIYLRRGSIEDFSSLAAFTNLKRLELLDYDKTLTEIDLSVFPNLEVFRCYQGRVLTSITGLESHPSLELLEIVNCNLLTSLGSDFSESKISSVYFSRLYEFTDLNALGSAPNLSHLRVLYCDKISDASLIDLDSLDWCTTYNCDNLPSQKTNP